MSAPTADRWGNLWWREEGVRPYLELRFVPAHELVALGKDAKPKATGEWVSEVVEVGTGPAGMTPATSSPARLRTMAALLLEAADHLEELQRAPADPPPGQLTIDTLVAP